LTAFGKIIGGGFPVGAFGGRAEIMAVFDPSGGKPLVPHGGTFSANPMTMRCGLAAMELLDEPAFERLNAMGELLRCKIEGIFERRDVQGGVNGRGSLLKIYFGGRSIRDYRSSRPTTGAAKQMNAFVIGLLNAGVIIASTGLIALSTPTTEDDIEFVVSAIDRVLNRAL
jgi:glutamate-1-semialdehyde 2,1-aminomutase